MIDRREVEELLAACEMIREHELDPMKYSPIVPAPELAALCRAWLALNSGIYVTLSRNDVDAWSLPDSWSGQRVQIVKEEEW